MNKWLKRALIGAGAFTLIASTGFFIVSAQASGRLERRFETHHHQLTLPAEPDPAAVARGKHLVHARYGCAGCHGEDLSGGVMLDEAPIGKLLGPNLTRGKGSRVEGYDPEDWDRAVRHGVKKDGRPSLMPSEDFFQMSDEELTDIILYARSLPPINAESPPSQMGPVGKVLIVTGQFPLAAERQNPEQRHAPAPPAMSDTRAFGEHLTATCTGCHRPNLAGGPMPFGPPDWPAAANLTQHEQGFRDASFEDFDRALTQGIGKDGRKLQKPMSEVVAGTKNMLPSERQALWTYLRSLPPMKTGT